MGLRGISGVIVPKKGHRSKGSAIIRLEFADLAPGADGAFAEVAHFGSGKFMTEPCKMISLRRVSIQDSDKPDGFPVSFDRTHLDTLNLDDNYDIENGEFSRLRIRWKASPNEGVEIREISVFIIGETEE